MGPNRRIRGTYSKLRQAPATEEERRKQYKQRRNVPQFDHLFLPKDENKETSSSLDPFDSLIGGVKKAPNAVEPPTKVPHTKSIRTPLAVNSLLTNSTFKSEGHSSANDTFDKLVSINNRLAASKCQGFNGALSSSNSSFDATGILYRSLRSHTLSHLQCSSDDKSKIQSIKKEFDNSRRDLGRPSVILEDVCNVIDISPGVNKSHVKDVKSLVSPQLFSSGDEKHHRQTRVSEPKKRKSKVKRKSRKASKSGTRTSRNNVPEKQLNSNDDSRLKEITDSNASCNDIPTRYSDSPQKRFKKPSVIIRSDNSESSPHIDEKVVLSSGLLHHSSKGFTGTPSNSNFAKAVLHHKLVSSQSRLSPALQISRVSQESGKSSAKSDALTSTPADTSRVKSLTDNFGLWNVQDEVISPVPRESSSLCGVNSPSVFQSPMSNHLKSTSLSNQKSGGNPSHGSCYHTCVSDTCGAVNCTKVSRSSKIKECKEVSIDCSNKIAVGGESYYNSSLELQSGPFKGVNIPLFDPSGGIKGVPPKGYSSPVLNELPNILELHAAEIQSKAQTSTEQSAVWRNITMTSQESMDTKKVQVSGGHFLHEMSKNFSSEKLKQINSFLNQQSFGVPLRTRQQKRKFSKNRVEPLPLVKRLRRRTARISKLQTNGTVADTEESSCMSQKENVNTDQSTATEPSFVLPRRKQFILKNCFTRELSGLRSDVNSSSDSVVSNGPVILPRGSGSAYAAESYFAKPSPVLPRRTSNRLAIKRKTGRGAYNCKNFGDTSFRLLEKPYVSTRSTTRRLQNTKKLSIMEFSLSSVRSTSTDHEDSKWSVSSKNAASDTDSAYSTTERESRISQNEEVSLPGDCHVESSVPPSFSSKSENLGNQVIKEEDEDSSVVCDDGKSLAEDNSQVRNSLAPSVEASEASFMGDEKSNLDISSEDIFKLPFHAAVPTKRGKVYQVIKEEAEDSSVVCEDGKSLTEDNSQIRSSLAPSVEASEASFMGDEKFDLDICSDDVFELPFHAAVPTKRGKGWIRSLSIARASLIGSKQMREIMRRQTVHRMSVGGRRVTQLHLSGLPEMTVKCIKEIAESTSQDEDHLSHSIICDPRRHVLALCSQMEPLPITDCFTESRMSCCRKIGEGVYGEVFMTKPNPNSMDGATVLKIMPIEGDFDVNGETQKKFSEILSEIIISLELSNLRDSKEKSNWTENFVHVLNCWCVEGSYHHDMLQLWDLYHEEKGSENDRPDIFPESQLYIVLEFTHGGRDLEGFVFNNAGQSVALFLQIAYSLAVAEQELEFEHRDLHWGNVLVAVTKDSSVDFRINGGTYTLSTQGVKATVIDFTLSRLKAPHSVMYNNLAEDPSLFTAQGDYQFEIYRQMKKANRNEWQSFTPYTNVLWLHYILDKMISECYYKNVKTKVHKTNLDQLKKLKETMLQSESATAFVLRREHNIA